MKKKFLVPLATAALLFRAGASPAASVGVGVFGGTSITVIQDDNKGGSIFGARVPINLVSILTVEPYYGRSSGGEVTEVFDNLTFTRTGYDVKTFGANLVLGSPVGSAGFKFFPYAGLGSNKLTRTGSDEIKETGYNFGLGLGAGVTPDFSLIARGGVNMIKTGDTSRKFADVTLNLYYNIFKSKK